MVRCRLSVPRVNRIYKDFQPYASHPELPKFNGELLMDVHGTGCYTSQAAMKLYNRQNELLGDAAERSSVVAEWLNQASYPGAALTENWQRFISISSMMTLREQVYRGLMNSHGMTS